MGYLGLPLIYHKVWVFAEAYGMPLVGAKVDLCIGIMWATDGKRLCKRMTIRARRRETAD